MTVSPWTFFRSELTVSAMPVPIQSSAGSRVMLAKVITATELSTRRRTAAAMRERPARTGVELGGDPLQVVVDIARRLVAELRGLLERAGDDRVERRRHGADESRHRRRVLVEDAVDDLGRRRAVKRHVPGQHLEEHDAEREEVGAMVDRLAERLLGRHVRHRADHRAGHGHLRRVTSAAAWPATNFARPKSRTFTRPRSVRIRLALLMSR